MTGRTFKIQHVTRSQIDRIAALMEATGTRSGALYVLTAVHDDGEASDRPASSSDIVLRVGDSLCCTIEPSGRVTEAEPRPS